MRGKKAVWVGLTFPKRFGRASVTQSPLAFLEVQQIFFGTATQSLYA